MGELRNLQTKINAEVINVCCKEVLCHLLAETFEEDIERLFNEINGNNDWVVNNKAPLVVNGDTPYQKAFNNPVDFCYNVIINYFTDGRTFNRKKDKRDGTVAKKICDYLRKNGISLYPDDLIKHCVNIRSIRNKASHQNEDTELKNGVDAANKVKQIRNFMSIFKVLYEEQWNEYDSLEPDYIDFIADYVKRNNENAGEYESLFVKSGMIGVSDFVGELCEEDFENIERKEVELVVYRLLGEMRISCVSNRFMKNRAAILRRFILENSAALNLLSEAEKIENNITGETEISKESIEEVINEIEEIRREWFIENCYDISDQDVASLINDNNIFIDFRFLCDDSFLDFLNTRILPFMGSGDYIFLQSEFKNFYQQNYNKGNSKFDEFVNKCSDKIKLFSEKNESGTLVIRDVVVNRYAHNFLVITKDESLKNAFASEPLNATVILVSKRANKQSANQNTDNNKNQNNNPNSNQYKNQNKNQNNNQNNFVPLFEKKAIDLYIEDEPLNVSNIPVEGEFVCDKAGNPIKLIEEIGNGGEGKIYSCSVEGHVAKIYSAHCNTKNRKEKLELMSTKQIDMDGICWPKTTLYNHKGEFVGYIMAKAAGYNFEVMTRNVGAVIKKRGWTRKQLVECLINIMKMFDYLHRNNIVVGDVNGENIMIESYDKVYFVDTDSYQLDIYPCLVQKIIYVDPLQKVNPGERLSYTIHDDYYKLACIAYSTIMTGQHPYQVSDGIPGGVFRFTEKGQKETAKPVYNYIWSNIERSVKKLLLNVFDNGDRNITARAWIKALSNYIKDIGDDEERNKIEIERYRGSGFEENIRCSRCNGLLNMTVDLARERVEKYGADKILCRDCATFDRLDKGKFTYMTCPVCRRMLSVSEEFLENQKAKGYTNIKCSDCNNGYGARPLYPIPKLKDVILEIEGNS